MIFNFFAQTQLVGVWFGFEMQLELKTPPCLILIKLVIK